MKKVIVTTTINPPTEALVKFSAMPDWELVVVGDRKTPHEEYSKLRVTYFDPSSQENEFPELSDLIGWNCIQRRNLGFLKALEIGADIIASVDDDNIPLQGWGDDIWIGSKVQAKKFTPNAHGWFDPISAAGEPTLWHRGYPIQYLSEREFKEEASEITPDVQANFWNGDPDIDAICRMEHSPDVTFQDEKFPFFSGGVSPFNSQNTMLSRNALAEYFMYPGVGRMDDIWSSFYLMSKGFKVLYDKATVRQERNPHDLTIDFRAEVLGYEKNYLMLQSILGDPDSLREFLPESSWKAFQLYKTIANSIIG